MKKQFDFIGHRKVFLIISLVIIVAGILCSILMPIDLDISFKGGTLVRYTFSGDLDEGQVDDFVSAQLGRSVEVPPFSSDMSGTSLIEISLPDQLSVEELDALHAAMAEEYSDHNITLVQANSLKPSMGRNFLIKCLVAVALAAIFLVIYVALRFRKIGGWSAGGDGGCRAVPRSADCILCVCGFPDSAQR